jgi:hypothetical protein
MCEGYCTGKSYTVVDIVSDDDSSDDDYPTRHARSWNSGLIHAVKLCETGQASAIVACGPECFASTPARFAMLCQRAHKYGYRLESASDGRSVNEMPVAHEVSEHDHMTRRLLDGRQKRGQRDGCGSGPLPYGYCHDDDDHVVVDETAALAIQTVLALKHNKSMAQIAAHLNQMGLRTATGKLWNRSSVQKVLKHETLYRTGRREWGGIEAVEQWQPVVAYDSPHSEYAE